MNVIDIILGFALAITIAMLPYIIIMLAFCADDYIMGIGSEEDEK